MSVIMGSARIDENGNTHGGAAGDQGNEVSTQTFYIHSKGWYGFIPKSNDVAEKIASAMQDACDNDYIGYDQYERDTLLTQYKKYGSIKAIKTKCECDCSSLVRVCIYQATGVLLSDFDTSGEPSVLASSGFFKDKISVTSASQATLGMIVVTKSKGHTGAIISGAPLGGSSSSETTGGTTSGTTSSTKKVEDASSGPDDSIAGTYKVVNASDGLNVRYGAGMDKDIVTSISNGTPVTNFGYYTTVNETKWLVVQLKDGTTGYVSSKYLSKTSSSSSSSGTTSGTSSSKLDEDGEIGKKTVIKLQKVMGTEQDGFIDGQQSASKKYWTSILTEACKWTGGASAVVQALQTYLKNKGYSCGIVDGKLGKKTATALQNYLIKQGYSCGSAGADGEFGTNSAKALQKWLNTK